MESNTQLIANKTALADAWKRTKIENIALLLKAAIEAQGRVGLMLNVRRDGSRQRPRPAAGAAAADHLAAERRRLGGGEHDHRRAHGARPDPEAEGGRSARDRRVPAEQDRAVVMRIIDSKNKRQVDALLRRDGRGDAAFEKRVRDIVNGVRRGGDKALSRFAERFDNAGEPLEVLNRGNARLRRARAGRCQAGHQDRRAQHREGRVSTDSGTRRSASRPQHMK